MPRSRDSSALLPRLFLWRRPRSAHVLSPWSTLALRSRSSPVFVLFFFSPAPADAQRQIYFVWFRQEGSHPIVAVQLRRTENHRQLWFARQPPSLNHPVFAAHAGPEESLTTSGGMNALTDAAVRDWLGERWTKRCEAAAAYGGRQWRKSLIKHNFTVVETEHAKAEPRQTDKCKRCQRRTRVLSTRHLENDLSGAPDRVTKE